MSFLKTHFQVHEFGSPETKEQWEREGLIPDKVKFCDGLMLNKSGEFDFTKDIEAVDCKKCLKKIDTWARHGFDLPY